MEDTLTVAGNIVDVVAGRIFQGTVEIAGGKIIRIVETAVEEEQYILPGLIDAHIHIESSMLIPSEFARLAVVHGTVGTVSDPHEIANVLGVPGVLFMIRNGGKVPFKFCFGAPSCVPATTFETAGAALGVEEVRELLSMKEIGYLSEMMNVPGVLFEDPEVMKKLELARAAGKPVDGHAPGVRGTDAAKYVNAGILTDHECFTLEEAREKIGYGMKILIREGSAAKNFEALSPLIDESPESVMLCSDDRHPDDLVNGHLDRIVKRALKKGHDPIRVLRSCTLNPIVHYGLKAGLLQCGDPADFILVNNLHDFKVKATYIDGKKVAENGQSLIERVIETPFNHFSTAKIGPADLKVVAETESLRVMKALDGQLITLSEIIPSQVDHGEVVSDPDRDVLKLVVKNRYGNTPVAVGFIKGFGLKKGALASCVAHDSHNIVAVGCDDQSITTAINLLVEAKGGISAVDGGNERILPLPFAGIMSGDNGYDVATQYEMLNSIAREMGCTLGAPYMTLSFMALLVIPELKLSDKGLFDGNTFSFTSLFQKK